MDIVTNFIKDIAIEQLMKTPAGEKLQFATNTVESIQQHFYALSDKQDELGMTGVKVITVLTFAILKKISAGKNTSELSNDDWKDIAKAVSNYTIIADDQQYSVFVFSMYERYILGSARMIENIVPSDAVVPIKSLARELHEKSELLKSNKISEASYIEDCLWISLEAMIKLIASTTFLTGKNELSELAQALSAYAFEYGRMLLYKKEQAIIKEYLEGQHQLDKELGEKYAAFLSELQQQADQFSVLIENAFSMNFRENYLNSVKLALSVGVPDSEVLKTTDDIDDFFLN